MRMGLTFTHIVPTKVAAKSSTLIQNCQGLTEGEEKFSSLSSSSVAAAYSPTTAGRRPANTLRTGAVSI